MTDVPSPEGEPIPAFDFDALMEDRDVAFMYQPVVVGELVLLPLAKLVLAQAEAGDGSSSGADIRVPTIVDDRQASVEIKVLREELEHSDDDTITGVVLRMEQVIADPRERQVVFDDIFEALESETKMLDEQLALNQLIRAVYDSTAIGSGGRLTADHVRINVTTRFFREAVIKGLVPRLGQECTYRGDGTMELREYVAIRDVGRQHRMYTSIATNANDTEKDRCLLHWTDLMMLRTMIEKLGFNEAVGDDLTRISCDPIIFDEGDQD